MKHYLTLFKSPEAASIIIHLVLFLILTLIVIRPQEAVQWHSFEWQAPPEDPDPKGNASVQYARDVMPRAETVQERQVPDQVREPQVTSEIPPSRKPVESELVDPVHHPDLHDTSPKLPPITRGLRHIQGTPDREGQAGGEREFGEIMDTDDIEIIHRVKPDIEVREFGSVTLTFRLRSNGTVDPYSIVVMGFDRGAYGTASEDALKQWRFRFKGRFNPNKVYQITFKFTPQ